jgi:hypothetical protein
LICLALLPQQVESKGYYWVEVDSSASDSWCIMYMTGKPYYTWTRIDGSGDSYDNRSEFLKVIGPISPNKEIKVEPFHGKTGWYWIDNKVIVYFDGKKYYTDRGEVRRAKILNDIETINGPIPAPSAHASSERLP